MIKLGDKLSGHRDYDDDTERFHYCKCGEPATRQETFYRGINEYRHSYQEWICEECYDRLDEEELSRCCGAPFDSRFPNDEICSKCFEHN